MSIVSKSVQILRMAAAFLLLPLLASSCQWVTDDYDDETADVSNATQYINITISVSASESPVTRAPLGGEEGDGREKGIDTRENLVEGVTLIFYQDAPNTTAGINATAANAAATTIDHAVYYTVSRDDDHAYAHPTRHTGEVFYTTGDQELTEPLSSENDYHLLVVANADLTQGSDRIIPGTTTLAQVRDMTYSAVYSGTGKGTEATKFVMTSEEDCILDFNYSTYNKALNRRTFQLDCIHMERMAARIDYCTEGADSYDTNLGGYKYPVGTNGGYFVVTKVTPFNLYDGSEYVFKRVRNNWTDVTPSISWLGDETTTNYVVDPNTANKDNNHSFTYLSPVAQNMDNGYTQSMSSAQNQNKENVIICYTRENTLKPASPLKKYATGLAFEIKYYVTADATPVTRVYYHYLRHQGEMSSGSYQAYLWADLSDETTCGTTPMNYGIVRNNIYRVTVNSFTPLEGVLKITIEEKHWRHVDNPTIYI